MYLGIDLGTSGVKAVLLDDEGHILRSASAPIPISRPQPLWSEQNPEDWWTATQSTLTTLKQHRSLDGLRCIGLTGQMHGATLLDAQDVPVRPAILWNDGRASIECEILESRVPQSAAITGNRIMPGFTAPKLLWVAAREPRAFAATRRVLLPKDYLRLRLTGTYATDMSDAAGTMWLDVGQRAWSDPMLAASSIDRSFMPEVFEGPEPTGTLTSAVADFLGCDRVPVVAGAGDNAAGALGVGVTSPGEAMLSLGTSGTYFVVTDEFRRNPERGVHSFCHALPETWHVMSVTLSAASCLSWLRNVTGAQNVTQLLQEAESIEESSTELMFLPYLAGERTPHNDPNATGAFVGLTHNTERGHLAYAVMEGVALALACGARVLHDATEAPAKVTLIGGGAQSTLWMRLVADALAIPMQLKDGADVAPAVGAANLARRADNPNEAPSAIFLKPSILREYEPNRHRTAYLAERAEIFSDLYFRLKK